MSEISGLVGSQNHVCIGASVIRSSLQRKVISNTVYDTMKT